MKVQRKDNEILIRFSAGNMVGRIQSVLDYLRYEELTAYSNATKEYADLLLKEAKSERWDKIKKEIGFDGLKH